MTARSWFTAAGTAIALLASLAPAPAAEKVALLVGVGTYDHAQLDDLKYAERDAEETAKLLRGSGFTRVVVLSGQAEPYRPTRDNVRRELEELLRRRTKRDTILVALSGHGLQRDGDADSYFCPADANPTKPETMLSLPALSRELEASGVGVKLLLVDACRNDPGTKGARAAHGVDGTNLGSLARGTGVLFSCSPGQRSFENDAWRHGAFFYTVLEGLRPNAAGHFPADGDDDGEVDFDELSRYVRKSVPGRVANVVPGAEQTPNAISDLTGLVTLVRAPSGRRPVAKVVEPPRPSGPPEDLAAKTVGMKMRLVSAGSFLMGSPDSDGLAAADEKPRHEVRLTRSFYLGVCEVTVGQFAAFVRDTGHRTTAEADPRGGYGFDGRLKRFVQSASYTWRSPSFSQESDHPVVNVSWDDAVAFCGWLAKREGKPYRLPTEAEWEHACRAGQRSRYATGEDDDGLEGYANVGEQSLRAVYSTATEAAYWNDGYAFTAPTGSSRPNAWGLYDLHGNVREWCADGGRVYGRGRITDPVGPNKTAERAARGGSWRNQPRLCRSAARVSLDRASCLPNVGFRVALSEGD